MNDGVVLRSGSTTVIVSTDGVTLEQDCWVAVVSEQVTVCDTGTGVVGHDVLGTQQWLVPQTATVLLRPSPGAFSAVPIVVGPGRSRWALDVATGAPGQDLGSGGRLVEGDARHPILRDAGVLVMLSSDGASVQWRADIGDPVDPQLATVGDTVIVVDAGVVITLSASNGRELSRVDTGTATLMLHDGAVLSLGQLPDEFGPVSTSTGLTRWVVG